MKKRITTLGLAVLLVAAAWIGYPLSNRSNVASALSSCPTDLFSALTPDNTNFNDPDAVNVGVKFHVNGAPFVRGVKFYKGVDNTGTHVAHLREDGGMSDLASATYTSETSSGWQSVDFGSDVPVESGVTYVVWISMPNGHYAVDGGNIGGPNDFTHSFGDPFTDALYVTSGNSSLYEYTGTHSTVPTHASSANYWVSPVVGDATDPDANTSVAVSNATAGPSVTWSAAGKDTNAATSSADPVYTSIVRGGTTVGRQSGGQSSWSYGPNDPTALPGTMYSYTVVNTDACGNTSSDSSHAVTTPSQTLSNLFSSNPSTASSATSAVTVGMHWQTATAGNVWGTRIYRAANTTPTGAAPMVAGLWDNDGTLLAFRSIPLGNEQSGWIDVRFSSPVSVSANHDYVIGYFTPNGKEVYTNSTFSSAVTNGDLSAQADGVSTPNGVYNLGSNIAFPSTRSSNAAWYGVDVDFYVP